MEAPRAGNPSHQRVWACSCQARGAFCSFCILRHIGSPGECPAVVLIASPVGPLVCLRCFTLPTDVISFNDKIYLCHNCATDLWPIEGADDRREDYRTPEDELQSHPPDTQWLIDKIADIRRANEELRSANESLSAEVQDLKNRLQDALTAQAESRLRVVFSELALINLEGPGNIREVMRNCARISEFLGPTSLTEGFARSVVNRFRNNPQQGFRFAQQYYGAYDYVKDNSKGRETLTAMLGLLDKEDTLDQVVKVFHHLRKLTREQDLCEFTIAASANFQHENSKPEEWSNSLLKLPEKWNDDYRPTAEKSLSGFLQAVCHKDFSDDYLLLSHLMCQKDNQLPVFGVVDRLSEMMKSDENIQKVRTVTENLIVINETAEISHINTTFTVMPYLLKDPEPEKLEILAEGIQRISGKVVDTHFSGRVVDTLFTGLTRVLGQLENQDTASELGFATFKCAVNDQHQGVRLAQRLLTALETNQSTIEESSKEVASFLNNLPIPCRCGRCETCVQRRQEAETELSERYQHIAFPINSLVVPELITQVFSNFDHLECDGCHQLFKRKNFPVQEHFEPAVFVLDCGDSLCVRCLERSYRQGDNQCPTCGQVTSMHKEELLEMKETCWQCGKLSTVGRSFCGVCCSDHRCCTECLSQDVNIEKCGRCDRQYSAAERRVLANLVPRMCAECGNYFQFDEMWPKAENCNCSLCQTCGLRLLCSSLNIETCLRCEQGVSEREMTLCYNRVRKIPLEGACYMEEFLASRAEVRSVITCHICNLPVTSAFERVTSGEFCPHLFHRDCLGQAIEKEIARCEMKKEFTCPIAGCPVEVDPLHLTGFAAIISEEKYDSYQRLMIKLDFLEFVCKMCKTIGYVEIGVTHFNCQCGFNQCIKCSSNWTPAHNDRICQFYFIEALVHMMEDTPCACENNGCDRCMIAQCPGCKFPYHKNAYCDHVKCARKECGVEFCFRCSCLRTPTLKHSVHWHRPQCPYNPNDSLQRSQLVIDSQRMSNECPECTHFGRRCDPPKDLRVPRRFTLEEYLEG